MSEQPTLIDALRSRNFELALSLLESGQDLPSDASAIDRLNIYPQLFQQKAYNIILSLLDNGLIEKDLYEYDSLNQGIFTDIFRSLPADQDALDFAAEFFGRLENVEEEVKGRPLLDYALEAGADAPLLQVMISAGCDASYTYNSEETYLHKLPAYTWSKPDRGVRLVELFTNEGVDVNALNVEGVSALTKAIQRNSPELVSALMEQGADPNVQQQSGETPYYHAVISQRSLELYKRMRTFTPPDFELQTRNGETILFTYLRNINRASEKELDFLSMLIEDGADLLQPAKWYDQTTTAFELLPEKSFDVFKRVIELDKVDISNVFDDGNTLLHKVCAWDVRHDQDAAKDTYRKVKLLIELGADVNQTNAKDETPLMLASTDNLKTKTVELLLKASKS